MSRRVGIVALAFALACCSKSDVKSGGGAVGSSVDSGPPPKPTFTLFALAEMRGQIGPCGCTSDPLGDISRTAQLIDQARAAGPTLVVDAGSLLYSKSPIPPHLEAQEQLKAKLLLDTYKERLQVAAVGLGPADLAKGAGHVALPRQAANVTDKSVPVEAPKVIDVGGAKVGVFGVAMPDVIEGVAAGDPVAAGKAAVAELEGKGAQVIVGLLQAATKKDAAKLARDIGGIDFAIAGLGANAPEPERVDIEAQKVSDGWLVVPANRGQIVPRLDVTVRGGGVFVDAVGSGAASAKIAALDKRIAELDEELKRLAADPSAEPAFVKQSEDERKQLLEDKNRLAKQPLVVPRQGSYFTMQQLRIAKTLACDQPVQSAVTAFYTAAGEANLEAAGDTKPPAPPKGKASYVGGEACDDCHGDAVEFWQKTRHANAWETLVERGQQYDLDCIGCHVTGWAAPGGANLAFNEPLRDVQCETCHGPASIHIEKGGEEKPPSVWRAAPSDLCASQCHTKEHSDTFELKAYLRDITGPGHGEALRKQLGDGPTGGELRKAALAKAGKFGPGCIR